MINESQSFKIQHAEELPFDIIFALMIAFVSNRDLCMLYVIHYFSG
jgi:hypothetical protein